MRVGRRRGLSVCARAKRSPRTLSLRKRVVSARSGSRSSASTPRAELSPLRRTCDAPFPERRFWMFAHASAWCSGGLHVSPRRPVCLNCRGASGISRGAGVALRFRHLREGGCLGALRSKPSNASPSSTILSCSYPRRRGLPGLLKNAAFRFGRELRLANLPQRLTGDEVGGGRSSRSVGGLEHREVRKRCATL